MRKCEQSWAASSHPGTVGQHCLGQPSRSPTSSRHLSQTPLPRCRADSCIHVVCCSLWPTKQLTVSSWAPWKVAKTKGPKRCHSIDAGQGNGWHLPNENAHTLQVWRWPYFQLHGCCGRTRQRKPTDLVQLVILTFCPQSLARYGKQEVMVCNDLCFGICLLCLPGSQGVRAPYPSLNLFFYSWESSWNPGGQGSLIPAFQMCVITNYVRWADIQLG